METIETFATLFAGRTDAYGSWEGGSVKSTVNQGSYAKHLWGQDYIGIYPLRDDSTVVWGCSDIDVNEPDMAFNLQTALMVKGISSFIEQTVRGFHVWVFAEHPVHAWKMRRALLMAHTVVKVPAKEINPKQETAIGLGNYVRLPYPGDMLELSNVRFMVGDNLERIKLDDFLGMAIASRASDAALESIASQYVVKTPAMFDASGLEATMDYAKSILTPYTYKILEDGPLPNSDRSTTLVRLVHRMRAEGIDPSTAFTILKSADHRWGKFFSREDGIQQMSKIVSDVYGV